MKKNIFTFILFLSCVSITAQEYILNGKVNDPAYNGAKVYLQAIERGDTAYSPKDLDSTTVTNGSFLFREAAETLDIRIVSIHALDNQNKKRIAAIFISEPGTIDITLDSISIVDGPAENGKHKVYTESQREIYDQMRSTQNEAIRLRVDGKLTQEKVSELEDKFNKYQQQLVDVSFNYVKDNMGNRIGEFYFVALGSAFTADQIVALHKLSRKEYQESPLVKDMMTALVPTPQPYDGGQFKDVELSTPEGKKAMISDYVGKDKVVLIDFWASWCGPCRKEMPELVELYKEYKDKGFEILGISLDDNLSGWTRAIKTMNMTWANLSDLGGWNSKAARIYEVRSIPQSFLVDKKGNMVGHNLKGAALKIKIEELLNEE